MTASDVKGLKQATKDLIAQVHGFEKQLSLSPLRRLDMIERTRVFEKQLELFFESLSTPT
ncbi:MAG: hypothetical protein ABR586_06475 [Thermoplasmatota archaeon]